MYRHNGKLNKNIGKLCKCGKSVSQLYGWDEKTVHFRFTSPFLAYAIGRKHKQGAETTLNEFLFSARQLSLLNYGMTFAFSFQEIGWDHSDRKSHFPSSNMRCSLFDGICYSIIALLYIFLSNLLLYSS